jgi:cob(I)alamin adenosyltransferase
MGLTTQRHVEQLERDIDTYDAQVLPLQQFILPGGVRSAALLHVARTVCRRAERRVVGLECSRGGGGLESLQTPIVRYLNRLGDLLFVLPRVLNARADVPDVGWQKDA